MPAIIETAHLTDPGWEMSVNEDAVIVLETPVPIRHKFGVASVIAVADGADGNVASGLVAHIIERLFNSDRLLVVNDGEEAVTDVIRTANREIFKYAQGTGEAKPATTVTLAALGAADYVIGHVGNSRAYRINQTGIWQITEDDSLVSEAIRAGELTKDQAKRSPMKGKLTKSVGVDVLLSPTVMRGMWSPGDLILLCTDGLTDYLEKSEVFEIIGRSTDLQLGCQALIQAANSKGGTDNITVAIARNVSGPIPEAPEPRTPERQTQTATKRIPVAVGGAVFLVAVCLGGMYAARKALHLTKPKAPPISVPVTVNRPPTKTLPPKTVVKAPTSKPTPPASIKPTCSLSLDTATKQLILTCPPEFEIKTHGSPDDHDYKANADGSVTVAIRDVPHTLDLFDAGYRLGLADGDKVIATSDQQGKIDSSEVPTTRLSLVLLDTKGINTTMLEFTVRAAKTKKTP